MNGRDPTYGKYRYVAAPDAWTMIAPPWHCNYMGMRHIGAVDGVHGAVILTRSNQYDPETEDVLVEGAQEGVTSPFDAQGMKHPTRFQKGECVLSVKSAGEYPQLLVVTWVR